MNTINFAVAFLGGSASFFAPCIVPLLPAYISFISSVSIQTLQQEKGFGPYKKRVLLSALLFSLGFTLVFVVLGMTAASFGLFIRQHLPQIQRVGGVLIMLFSLQFLGLIPLPHVVRNFQPQKIKWIMALGELRVVVLGMIFAVAWSPCVGPVLGAILTLAAVSATVWNGAFLLFFYAMGISLPFVILSIVIAFVPLVFRFIQRSSRVLQYLSGVVLFVFGFLLFNNSVGLLSQALTYNSLHAWAFRLFSLVGYVAP